MQRFKRLRGFFTFIFLLSAHPSFSLKREVVKAAENCFIDPEREVTREDLEALLSPYYSDRNWGL